MNSTYDSMNRLTDRKYQSVSVNPSLEQTFAYTPTGERSSMRSSLGPNNFNITINSYDSRNRLVRKTVSWTAILSTIANISGSLSYGYDANGNVTNVASGYANGVNLTYAYDRQNRLTSALSHGQLAAAYSYDLAGNLTNMQYGNGVTNRYQYDSLNRVTNLIWGTHSSALASFAYTLMNGGTRTNALEVTNGVTWNAFQWSFDNLYRLTNENINPFGNATAKFGYSYDPVGNRLSRSSTTSQLPTDSYTYDTNDELFLTTGVGGDLHTNDYDANGNTTQTTAIMATNSYNYYHDYQQIYSATVNGNNINQISYDCDGNRVFKDVKSPDGTQDTVTFYLVDDRNPSGYPQVLEEYQGVWTNDGSSGWAVPLALHRAYNYGTALISQQQFDPISDLPTTVSYYGYDGHGSVRFLMNTNGGVTDAYTFDAFGSLIASNMVTPNNYLYSAQQRDPDLGLDYNRNRYLNTGIGRFWTMDGDYGNNDDPLSLHKYLYVADDPINRTDPSGDEAVGDSVVALQYFASFKSKNGPAVTITFNGKPKFNWCIYTQTKEMLLGHGTPGPTLGCPIHVRWNTEDPDFYRYQQNERGTLKVTQGGSEGKGTDIGQDNYSAQDYIDPLGVRAFQHDEYGIDLDIVIDFRCVDMFGITAAEKIATIKGNVKALMPNGPITVNNVTTFTLQ